MADLTFKHDDDLWGSGGAGTDTWNALFLANGMRATDGKNNWATSKKQTSDPSTGAGEIGLYCKSDGGDLKFFWRDESDGTVTSL